MKLNENAKRLIIYFFFDKEGVVDRYIPYMLEALTDNAAELVVVCNGALSEAGKATFAQYTDTIIERDNVGFDVWAYKEAMETVGYDKLATYDEVVLMNYTIMGPVYPLSEMFADMNARDLDFWGITQFYKTEDDPFGTMEDGYIPDHIQSHFIAVRRDMLASDDFRQYWSEMPMIESYLDSVGRHEARFTPYFAKKGYQWDVYVDAEEYRTISHQPIVGVARDVVARKRCPIFKRRSFMQDYTVVLNESMGEPAYELFEYLKSSTDYDTDLVLENLIRVENIADLKKNFQWNYILPTKTSTCHAACLDKKIALYMHIHFLDLVEECARYAANMPEHTDIFVTTTSEENKQRIEAVFGALPQKLVFVRVTPNRGRDVGPFLVEFADYYDKYDYICRVHDKKAGQSKPGSIGMSFAYKCFENMLPTKEYVENVIHVFEQNKFAGMLVAPPPNHADYYITLGLEWGLNYGVTRQLVDSLSLHANIREDREPIAGLGSFFWVRSTVLKPIFARSWSYDDFPEEPIESDGTILHALERVYPFAAQSEGYYTGWIMSEHAAAMEITNLNHMLHAINDIIFHEGQDAGNYHETRQKLHVAYSIVNDVRAGSYITLERARREGRLALIPGFIRKPLSKAWHRLHK